MGTRLKNFGEFAEKNINLIGVIVGTLAASGALFAGGIWFAANIWRADAALERVEELESKLPTISYHRLNLEDATPQLGNGLTLRYFAKTGSHAPGIAVVSDYHGLKRQGVHVRNVFVRHPDDRSDGVELVVAFGRQQNEDDIKGSLGVTLLQMGVGHSGTDESNAKPL